jgi:1,4-dihydroxy-2-naphthoyl-CoA synthase
MNTNDLILHCFADKSGDQWQAFCLDLTLAAQGDTFEDARAKLDAVAAPWGEREIATGLVTREMR